MSQTIMSPVAGWGRGELGAFAVLGEPAVPAARLRPGRIGLPDILSYLNKPSILVKYTWRIFAYLNG